MTANSRRGSEWRKWDLHFHAPGTKQNDQFRAPDGTQIWDEYCRRLHESDVQAFGITDYFSADCYSAAVTAYRTRYADSPKVFFPNVELRTNDVVNKEQEEVNILYVALTRARAAIRLNESFDDWLRHRRLLPG